MPEPTEEFIAGWCPECDMNCEDEPCQHKNFAAATHALLAAERERCALACYQAGCSAGFGCTPGPSDCADKIRSLK